MQDMSYESNRLQLMRLVEEALTQADALNLYRVAIPLNDALRELAPKRSSDALLREINTLLDRIG